MNGRGLAKRLFETQDVKIGILFFYRNFEILPHMEKKYFLAFDHYLYYTMTVCNALYDQLVSLVCLELTIVKRLPQRQTVKYFNILMRPSQGLGSCKHVGIII